MGGFILTIVAYILLLITFIPAMLVGIVISLIQCKVNRYFLGIAISLDKLGNVICQHLFNLVLITKDGYKFGNHNETVSSVLGKNYVEKTTTKLGTGICKILDWFEKNHVEKSIDNTVD